MARKGQKFREWNENDKLKKGYLVKGDGSVVVFKK